MLNELAKKAHENAVSKGFWDTIKSGAECIALMHSEVSEALEAMRQGGGECDKIPEIGAIDEEMADVIIRVLDFCAANDIDIDKAVRLKMEYNEGRTHMHGKQF